jgi:hypothetical protein
MIVKAMRVTGTVTKRPTPQSKTPPMFTSTVTRAKRSSWPR